MAQHHRPAERGRQRGDEKAVITAGNDAADRAGGVAAKAVGPAPFARQRRLWIVRIDDRPRTATDWITHRSSDGLTQWTAEAPRGDTGAVLPRFRRRTDSRRRGLLVRRPGSR